MAMRCDTCHETGSRREPLHKVVEMDYRPDAPSRDPIVLDLHEKCILVRLMNRPGRAYMRVKPAPREIHV